MALDLSKLMRFPRLSLPRLALPRARTAAAPAASPAAASAPAGAPGRSDLLGRLGQLPQLPQLPRLPVSGQQLDRARRIVDPVLGVAGAAGLLAVAAGGLGFMSSQYMIENPTTLNTHTAGSWVHWPMAGRTDADPYTRARFLRQGSLPLGSGIARTYEARYDSDGQRLHSSCEYGLSGESLDGSWWSIAVFDEHGRAIANPAERYAYTSRTIVRGSDGSYLVALSRDARPGNWLPTGGAGRLVLQLTMMSVVTNPAPSDQAAEARALPVIRRIACR